MMLKVGTRSISKSKESAASVLYLYGASPIFSLTFEVHTENKASIQQSIIYRLRLRRLTVDLAVTPLHASHFPCMKGQKCSIACLLI